MPETALPSCASCGAPAPHAIGRSGQKVPVCLRHYNAWQSPRCPLCGGQNGAHSMVHTRHRNGGGSNRPCPADASR